MNHDPFWTQFFTITYIVLFSYFIIVMIYHYAFTITAFFEDRRRGLEDKYEDYDIISKSRMTPPVSIVFAAYNEEKHIMNSLKALLNMKYPEYEVILVNDDSTDHTLEMVLKEFQMKPRDVFYKKSLNSAKIRGVYKSDLFPQLTVVDKEHSGKADSINAGVNLARYRYFCDTDADTVLEPGALLKAMYLLMRDPERIIAVSSYFGVGNLFTIEEGKILKRGFFKNLLIGCQNFEYLRSFIGNRVPWSKYHAMLCVPGGFGIYRKDFFIQMGGFSTKFSCEDIEFTFRAYDHFVKTKKDYMILMLPYVVGWTTGPTTIRGLIRQRNRWQRVTNETVWTYRHMLFNPKYKWIGMLMMPYFVLYEVLGPLMELLSVAVVILGAVLGYLYLKALLLFLAIMILAHALMTILTVYIFDKNQHLFSFKEMLGFIAFSFIEFLGYREIIFFGKLMGTIDFLRKKKQWEKVN